MKYRFLCNFLVIDIIKTFVLSSDPDLYLVKHTMDEFFSVFDIIRISKNSRISMKDEILANFQSFWVRNQISQGFIWVAIDSVSKAQLSAFLSVLLLFISQQNCRKLSEKMKILNC